MTQQNAVRRVLVPDLDDDLTAVLERLEEILIAVAQAEAEGEPIPAPLRGERARGIVGDLWSLLEPTQTRSGRGRSRGRELRRVLAPDGRYEHRAVSLVEVPGPDLDGLADAVAELGRQVAGSGDLAGIVQEFARDGQTAGDVVAEGARLHGLLALDWTLDTQLLADALEATTDDVVLAPEQEDAYTRVADRMNGIWALADPLDRWVY